MLQRRTFLSCAAAGIAVSAAWPGIAFAAANTEKRFVFIIQRGAADGLSIVAPVGDADFLRARGDLAQEALEGARLDDMFTLHPSLSHTANLYGRGEAAFVHAVASGYRERSHFDAQNILETGALQPYGRNDGWMNRLLGILPPADSKALAIAPSVPLALRGAAPVSSYERSRQSGVDEDMRARIAMLYAEDAELAELWQGAVETDAMADVQGNDLRGAQALGAMAASLMAGAQGARVLMLETNGWDTHSAQPRRLANQLGQLDAVVDAMHTGLGGDWTNTLVLVATEFGRTVAFNGTQGTDHGTASAAMWLGGAPKWGGTVQADWPGLSSASLLENRDLRPTLRMEDMIAAALSQHYAIDEAHMKAALFPDYT